MMVGQVTIWAAIFYSFPALVLEWQAEFGWSSSQVMGAFTLAIVIYAVLAPWNGRWIDSGFGPRTMPLASVLGAAGLLATTQVNGLVGFYLIWAVMGVAMSLGLYEACFALVTRARAADARRSITAITLVAGFASTLAYPLCGAIAAAYGWRAALWVMAAMVLLITLPTTIFGARRLEAEAADLPAPPKTEAAAASPSILRQPGFLPLAAGFACASLATGMLLSHLLPMLSAQGVTGSLAITAAALVGPAQVVGRLTMMTLGRTAPPVPIAQIAMATLCVGAVLILAASGQPWLALGFAVAQGAGYGVITLMRPTAVREVLGQERFGAKAGAVSAPGLFAFALAPALGAFIADTFGYGALIWVAIAAPLIGMLCLLAAPRNAD